jgi:Mrp family chromosome partitioning ATPase
MSQQGEQDLSKANEVCVGPQSAMAGKADSCKGCPNAAICASAPKGPDPDIEFMQQRLATVKHRVLVLSGKGGVGKSTMTKELGFALGRRGLLTGLVDTDICGPSLPRLTGVRDEPLHTSADGWEPVSVDDNVTLVSMHFLMNDKNEAVTWRGPQKNGMIKNFIKEVAWGELDCMLVDTPPGTSDEHISLVSFLKQCGGVSGAVIVTTPQEVAVADVRREIGFCKKAGVPILGFVENMSGFVCPKCGTKSIVFPSSRGEGAAARLSAEYGPPVLGQIPLDPALMKACEEGVALIDVDAESPTVAALDGVADKLVKALELLRSSEAAAP